MSLSYKYFLDILKDSEMGKLNKDDIQRYPNSYIWTIFYNDIHVLYVSKWSVSTKC